MYINVVHRHSHPGEKLMCTTYNAIGVKLAGTLQVCNDWAKSNEKARTVKNKTYTRASQPGEFFFYKTGPFPVSLIGNWYWVSVVDDYRLVPEQNVHFLYSHSHLRALQSCA